MFFIDFTNDYTWRYDLQKFVEMKDGVYDVIDSYFLFELYNLPVKGFIEAINEYRRPDLLSYYVYGDVQYWWIMMAFNHEMNVNDINPPKRLDYPSIDALEDLYFSLNALRNDFNTKSTLKFTKKPTISITTDYAPNTLTRPRVFDFGSTGEQEDNNMPNTVDLGST